MVDVVEVEMDKVWGWKLCGRVMVEMVGMIVESVKMKMRGWEGIMFEFRERLEVVGKGGREEVFVGGSNENEIVVRDDIDGWFERMLCWWIWEWVGMWEGRMLWVVMK